ncbi:MAG: C4-dicarboxylate ABC transporter permease [Alphaproteobacteria bacterium CG11_big_fil_rev_8_21_14_0_20_44_7]|nr:MAG: C4-dicarboxylate ABC transporter permease [Alphaproteobacteria bacterium CG11_big_fil_rev_8_21_14_0_20_44_7]
MQSLHKLIKACDYVNEIVGKTFSWLALALVITTAYTVFERYLFGSSEAWQNELIRFFHGILFLSVAGYTLKYDGHVRVDVFYGNFSERKKALVNLIGTIFLLFPFALTLLYLAWGFVSNSWQLMEGSREDNGLPGVFIFKSFILLFCITLIIQGISIISDSILRLKSWQK